MCVCIYIRIHVCVCACVHVCVYLYTYIHTYMCVCVCVYVCMYVCMYACMHACMYAYTHTHTHTRYQQAYQTSIRGQEDMSQASSMLLMLLQCKYRIFVLCAPPPLSPPPLLPPRHNINDNSVAYRALSRERWLSSSYSTTSPSTPTLQGYPPPQCLKDCRDAPFAYKSWENVRSSQVHQKRPNILSNET